MTSWGKLRPEFIQDIEDDMNFPALVIFLNCGAVQDLPSIIHDDSLFSEKTKVVVFDSHRPFHVANVTYDDT